jgi:PKD repeat protein
MRLPWFSGQPKRSKRGGKSRRRKAAPLRVRSLERRRVLNASIQTIAVPAVANEGSQVTATATATGQGQLNYTWTFTQGATTLATGTNPSFNFTPPDDGNYNVNLTVTDSTAVSDSKAVGLTVNNVPPQLVNVIGATVDENAVATITAKIQDPGVNDTFSVNVNWQDLTNDTITGLGASSSVGFIGNTGYDWNATTHELKLFHQYVDDGPSPGNATSSDTYHVALTVTDNHADSTSTTADVIVNNALPKFISVAADQTVNEGALVNLSGIGAPVLGVFTDAGTHDLHTATIDWGDGSGVQFVNLSEAAGSGVLTGTHVYSDNGAYTVSMVVTDDDTGASLPGIFHVTVKNVPPTIDTLAITTPINENDFATLSGTYHDPGSLDTQQLDIDWNGDGTFDQTVAVSGGAFSIQHQYLDDGPSPGNGTPSDTFTVHVRLRDNDGDSATGQTDLTVNNLKPVLAVADDQTVDEGQLLDLTGNGHPILELFVDTGTLDLHTATVDWGDGSPLYTPVVNEAGGSGSLTGSHTYADDGIYTVKVTVTDDDGGISDVGTFKVTVKNVPPQLVNVTGSTVNENGVATVTAKVQDPGVNDTFTVDVNWQDGSAVDHVTGLGASDTSGTVGTTTYQWTALTRQLTLSHQYLDDGPSPGNGTLSDTYHVALTVTDNHPDSTSTTADVIVNNLQPVLNVADNQTVNEGQLLDLTGNGHPILGVFVDTGTLDLHTATVDWGDGSPLYTPVVNEAGGSGSLTGSHTYADDGIYTVKVTVTDDDGGVSDVGTFKVTVKNVPPQLVNVTGSTINENGVATVTAKVQDPGANDTFTVDVNWQDGSATDHVTGLGASDTSGTVGTTTYKWTALTRQLILSHQYLDDGPSPGNGTASDTYHVALTVTDNHPDSTSTTAEVIVNNLQPVLNVADNQTVNEGQLLDLTGNGHRILGVFVDTGTLDLHTATVDWGDGSPLYTPVVNEAGGSGALTGSHIYADDGIYTVKVTVADDDGGVSDIGMFTVTVNNVDPVLTLTPTSPTTIAEGSGVSFNASFTDHGFDNPNNPNPATPTITDPKHESFTYDVSWGDGRNPITGMTANYTPGSDGVDSTGAFTGSHTYADDGTYTVTVTIHDDNGGSNSEMFTVTVNNADPVLTLTPTPPTTIFEGSSVAFNATFSDHGFDNPNNPTTPATGDPLNESFTYDINWGDGRDAVSGVAVADTNGSPGTPSTGSFSGSHTYADDGTYTVTVTIHDDNGGTDTKTFTVTVNNQNPTLTVTPTPPTTIFEGSSVAFNASFSDPGFDNPNNPTTPATGDPLNESFTYDINWGDGRDAVNGVALTDTNGSPGTPSTGSFSGNHTYADDGTYTVTVTIHDDNGGTDTKTFTVTVNNQNPALTVTPTPPTTIFEGSSIAFNATFSDPGFDNPNNPTTPATGDPLNESFTYDINWGDGRDALNGVAVSDTNGNPGTPSTGSFSGNHIYADDGTYTVTVTIHDDNGGTDTKTFTVTVNNQNPTLTVTPTPPTTIFEGSSVAFNAAFSDPGFDNPNNPTTPATGDPLNESFTYDINWGDGRDSVTGVAVSDTNGGPGTPSTGSLSGNHTYADDGTYTVTVTIHDDNGGVDTKTFTVTVNNVDPTLTGTSNLVVNEGQAFTLKDLGVGLEDPGFDNPNNPNPAVSPNITNTKQEVFTAYTINWGDGVGVSEPVSIDNVADRVSGSPGVKTTAKFTNAAYTYADDGIYTVTIMLQDDNGPIVARQFQITVKNVSPTLAVTPQAQTTINEAGSVTFNAVFTDPGFDNPSNPNSADPANNITDPKNESFTYDINWGDGRNTLNATQVADTNGSPGVNSSGAFSGNHVYADDGTYSVTVTIHDDNGGSDVRTFTVIVNNVNPTLGQFPFGVGDFKELQGTKLDSLGRSTITFNLTDPGFDNANNPNAANPAAHITDTKHETFTYVVDWGDGSVDAVHSYDQPLNPATQPVTVSIDGAAPVSLISDGKSLSVVTLVSNPSGLIDPNAAKTTHSFVVNWGDGTTSTFSLSVTLYDAPGVDDPTNADPTVRFANDGKTAINDAPRQSGSPGVATSASAHVTHTYITAPNAAQPANDIPIALAVFDDNDGPANDHLLGFSDIHSIILVSNPGITGQMIFIDTTPDVAELEFAPPTAVDVLVGQQTTTADILQNNDARAAAGDMAATSDRYLELRIVYPDGTEGQGYRIKDEALNNLRGFFKTLPDGHYKIYLVRTENNTRRLVIEVNVRRGHVIDVSDESEGTRDRPPTSEDQGQAPKPLNENPQLDPVPGGFGKNAPTAPTDSTADAAKSNGATDELPGADPAQSAIRNPKSEIDLPSRRAAAFTGLGLLATARPWSEEVDEALAEADERSWQRLRRASRRGRFGREDSQPNPRRPVAKI